MATFDKNSYLSPHEIIEMDFEEFVHLFVTNEHRVAIFEEYKHFIERLKVLDIGHFYQWVNGSFVSTLPKPGDIDIVTFVEYQKHEALEMELRTLKTSFKWVDSYYLKVYPVGHPNHFITNFDRAEWRFLFSTDRQKRKKGFVQLNF